MAMRFLDIRKRTYEFPEMGEKAYFIAGMTSSGTGSGNAFHYYHRQTTGAKVSAGRLSAAANMAIHRHRSDDVPASWSDLGIPVLYNDPRSGSALL